MSYVTTERFFGNIIDYVHKVEFQKQVHLEQIELSSLIDRLTTDQSVEKM